MHRIVRRTALLAAVSFLLLGSPLGAVSGADAQTAFKLDHFKCYTTTSKPLEVSVGLQDQFDDQFRDARVSPGVTLCNPVKKTVATPGAPPEVTPIRDPDAHLRFYPVVTSPVPTGGVVVRNQFAPEREVLSLQGRVLLAVPTQKLPHEAPQGLDHFKCYSVKGDPVNRSVQLKDQFTAGKAFVLDPFLFCNPTAKVHDDVLTPIENERDHLTCYRIRADRFETQVKIRNQFGGERLRTRQAESLCVPTEKLGFDISFP